jgi:chloramphenicol-sensitive protein RarD
LLCVAIQILLLVLLVIKYSIALYFNNTFYIIRDMLYIYYFIVNLIWGIAPLFDKYILQYIDILTLMLFVSLIHFLMLLGIILNRDGNFIKDCTTIINNKYIILVIIFATSMLLMANYGYLYTISNDKNVAIATLLTSLYPIVTLILGYFILSESLTTLEISGFILIFIGISFINYSRGLKKEDMSNLYKMST